MLVLFDASQEHLVVGNVVWRPNLKVIRNIIAMALHPYKDIEVLILPHVQNEDVWFQMPDRLKHEGQ